MDNLLVHKLWTVSRRLIVICTHIFLWSGSIKSTMFDNGPWRVTGSNEGNHTSENHNFVCQGELERT